MTIIIEASCAIVIVCTTRRLGLTHFQLIFLMQNLIHLFLAVTLIWLDNRILECWMSLLLDIVDVVVIAFLDIITIRRMHTYHSHVIINIDA